MTTRIASRGSARLAQTSIVGAIFLGLWIAGIVVGRQLGWNPGSSFDYLIVGVLGSLAFAITPLAPWVAVGVVGVVSAWPTWLFDVPELAVIPLAIAGYLAARSGARFLVLAGVMLVVTVGTVLPFLPDLEVGAELYVSALVYLDPSTRILAAVIVAAALLLGRAAWMQRKISDDLRHRNEELVALRAGDEARIAIEERTAIAREIHDVVAHHVTALVIRGQAAIRVSTATAGASRDDASEDLRNAVEWMTSSGRTALTAMREVVKVEKSDLRTFSRGPEATTFTASFEAMVEHVRETGIDVDSLLDLAAPIGTMQEFAVLRICQESLTNVLLHSKANAAYVRVIASGEMLDVEIIDAGPSSEGISAPVDDHRIHGGQGVRGMRERAEALGGTLVAERSISGGWRVKARLPVALDTAASS